MADGDVIRAASMIKSREAVNAIKVKGFEDRAEGICYFPLIHYDGEGPRCRSQVMFRAYPKTLIVIPKSVATRHERSD